MSSKVLVIDDDQRLQNLLARYLSEKDLRVYTALDAQDMQRQIQRNVFQLYILDINLPGKDGLEICRNLRASGDNTPIIMLTARGEDIDRITGLEIGADDYLAKPFNPRELLARIHSVLRRFHSSHAFEPDNGNLVYAFHGFTFDASAQAISYQDQSLPLNHNEFALLKVLIQNKGEAVSRTQLCHRIYGREHSPEQRDIDMIISRLRKHLSIHVGSHNFIQTVRGIGYRFID